MRLMIKCQMFWMIVLSFTIQTNVVAQDKPSQINSEQINNFSNPDFLNAPPKGAKGFPSRAADLDVLPGFKKPPAGYGEVPFWWWSGDPLDKDRLLWQIEELHKKGITGMQVNYVHTGESTGEMWPTAPMEPEIFTDAWWEMWKFAADECSKRDMGIGISGYTIDWPNSKNLFNDIIYSIIEIQGQELVADTILRVSDGNEVTLPVSNEVIGVWAYPVEGGKIASKGKNLSSFLNNSNLNWKPTKGEWEVWVFAAHRKPGTLNPMHPQSGATVIEKFFQPFQDNAIGQSADGLNYFFQDELKFGVGDRIWTTDFNERFQQQKGYDVFEVLPAMFTDMGIITAKARLDFMDVKVQLTEERYFKPIFDWHWSRGKIYGCDPNGRGTQPGEYGDNFRANRWYTAPGHDTPGGNADLIKGKVSSSIAHLYKRPRVWLEGYHSLGWGATPERLMFATSENYLYGCNLLNLHGLYYTTHGSFWEWAPPSYHFRMPYWEHMDVFLTYFERLSYLFSQGVLQTNIAILYPVSPAQVEMKKSGNATKIAFDSGRKLFNNGHNFIFMDHQSLERSEIEDGRFYVSDGSHQVLVLPAMSALRWSTMQQALKLYRDGGIVVAVGSLPEASDRIGSDDPKLNAAVKEIFGISATDLVDGGTPEKQTNSAGGIGLFVENADDLLSQLDELLPRDVQSDKEIRAMHRKVGPRDVYMVMDAEKGSYCTFRSKGKVEHWDPWTGKYTELFEVEETLNGTKVKMPLAANQAQVIVFTPENRQAEIVTTQLDEISDVKIDEGKVTVSGYALSPGRKSAAVKVDGQLQIVSGDATISPAPITLDGDWEFELQPTMDNRWGDFRLPVTEQMIGAEARIFSYAEESATLSGWEQPDIDDSNWDRVIHGYGQKFWKLGPLPTDMDVTKLEEQLASLQKVNPLIPIIVEGKTYNWQPYNFSWKMGVEDDPGDQGWHGLKEKVTDEFICLGRKIRKNNQSRYEQEDGGTRYYLWTSAHSEKDSKTIIDMGGLQPSAIFINGQEITGTKTKLKSGSNPLLLCYESFGRGYFVLKNGGNEINERAPLSMKWWNDQSIIPFDVNPDQQKPAGWYRFTAPPGLKSMKFKSNGIARVWIQGKEQSLKEVNSERGDNYKVEMDAHIQRSSTVAIRIEQERGFYGGAAIPEPILLDCEKGITETGDWSQQSALECYSGGAWYGKNIALSKTQVESRVVLNLGKVVATAEVRVNGKKAGVLVSPPWKLDISEFVQEGENKIEVGVFNTLSNHYSTIPSRYKGDSLESGLLGPVKMEFSAKVELVGLD